MKTHRVARDAPLENLVGMVLCHDVADHGSRLRKGRLLEPSDLAILRSASWSELHVIEIEDGDVHEDDASRRLAVAAAGDGVTLHTPSAGHWPLVATRRGVLDVAVDALRRANTFDGICIYTSYAGQIVDAGDQVARAKVAPLVIDDRSVCGAERVAVEARGLVRVRPFQPRRVGVVAAETLGEGAPTRIRAALTEKVSWFGSTLLEPAFVPPDEEALLSAIRKFTALGAELLFIAGMKPMDPLDPCWVALRRFGVTIERFGVPAHPGTLFWIAWHGDIPILGVPTCGLFSQATVFDLVLPRILAGERVGRVELADLGHGGLLGRDMAFRFPPYRGSGAARGAVRDE
jgi:hypothetical protein